MGTDIHIYAERRINGIWELCDGLNFPCENGRNYELFCILADVERMTNQGFEAISPPRGLPIDLSAQIQNSADEEREFGMCCHNHSWLLLRELLDFPWDKKKVTIRGYVDAEQYIAFKANGELDRFVPSEACGAWPSGQLNRIYAFVKSIVLFWKRSTSPTKPVPAIISNKEMETVIQEGTLASDKITEIAMNFTYADYCEDFLTFCKIRCRC